MKTIIPARSFSPHLFPVSLPSSLPLNTFNTAVSAFIFICLISRPQSQRVTPAPGCTVASVSPCRTVALPARGFDGCQSAQWRGSHAAAAGAGSRQRRAPGAAYTVRQQTPNPRHMQHSLVIHSSNIRVCRCCWARSFAVMLSNREWSFQPVLLSCSPPNPLATPPAGLSQVWADRSRLLRFCHDTGNLTLTLRQNLRWSSEESRHADILLLRRRLRDNNFLREVRRQVQCSLWLLQSYLKMQVSI